MSRVKIGISKINRVNKLILLINIRI